MIYSNLPAFSPQTPEDYLDNEFDFGDLIPAGDSLVSAVVVTDMSEMVLSNTVVGPRSVVCWVSGGVVGNAATLTCEATSAEGRIWYRSATMAINPVVGT